MTERREIDTALYNAVPHGAYTALAELRNVKRQSIAKYYDPKDGEYQSVFSKALLELQVIARVRPDWAGNIVNVFSMYVAKWCGGIQTPEAGGVLEEVIQLAAALLNPNTPETKRMNLAVRMHELAGRVVDGLRYDDMEGDSMDRPTASAKS